MNKIKLVLTMVLFFCASIVFSQEVAPEKTFEFSIGIDHLKTQEQADRISQKIKQINGVKNCTLVLIDYALVFQCTNYDLEKNTILDVVKQVLTEEGAEITIVNREIIKEDEDNK